MDIESKDKMIEQKDALELEEKNQILQMIILLVIVTMITIQILFMVKFKKYG